MQNHLLDVEAKKAGGPTWETVRYMISVIQYGGRITDDFDQLLMDTYADKYFHPVCNFTFRNGNPFSIIHRRFDHVCLVSPVTLRREIV